MAMNCTSLAGQDSLLSNPASNSIQLKEDPIKTQFDTREGCYKLLNSGEHYPPNRTGYITPPQTNIPVKCSFISLSDSCNNEKICYNVGRELYVYNFKANQKVKLALLSTFTRFYNIVVVILKISAI
jgi:WD-repeat protein, putative